MAQKTGIFRPVKGKLPWKNNIMGEIFGLIPKNRDLQIRLHNSVGMVMLHPLDVEAAFKKRGIPPRWPSMGRRLLAGVAAEREITAKTTTGLVYPVDRGLGQAVLALGIEPNNQLRADTKTIYSNLNAMLNYDPDDEDYVICPGSAFTIPLARLDRAPSTALAEELSAIVSANNPGVVRLAKAAPTYVIST